MSLVLGVLCVRRRQCNLPYKINYIKNQIKQREKEKEKKKSGRIQATVSPIKDEMNVNQVRKQAKYSLKQRALGFIVLPVLLVGSKTLSFFQVLSASFPSDSRYCPICTAPYQRTVSSYHSLCTRMQYHHGTCPPPPFLPAITS